MKDKLIQLCLILLFGLLIFKDPFSQRTLIPNFEPHPDTFNYLNPALNLVKGEGFNMAREGRVLPANVPFLYSFSLVPLFIFKADPRMAYYTNVLLAGASLFFFWSILKKFFDNKYIRYLLVVLYITNFFIYWVPSLVMAENLTLTLFLAGTYLLVLKPSFKSSVLMGMVVVGAYAAKYANIPLTGTLALFFTTKIILEKQAKEKTQKILTFISSLVLCFILFGLIEFFTRGNNFISQIFGNLSLILTNPFRIQTGTGVDVSSSPWFGLMYLLKNLPMYFNSLLGAPNRFLWDYTSLIPHWVGIFGLIGIASALLVKKIRPFAFFLALTLISTMLFMSTFYTFDDRYLYISIPILILGVGFLLLSLEDKLTFKKGKFFNIFCFIIVCVYLLTNFTRIKSQVSLNLRYAETPWYYLAVLKMNEYFTPDKIIDGRKPILISALAPYLVDYYSNGNYKLLPLSYDQEFRQDYVRQIVWGPNDYSNLPKLYKKYLDEGHQLYVSRSGIGNEGYTNRDFNQIVTQFNTILVLPGCYEQCNIYKVSLK